MIFIFGGPGKTGCSEISDRFAREHGFTKYSGGLLQKTMAFRLGFIKPGYKIPEDPKDWTAKILNQADLNRLRDHCRANNIDIDTEIDLELLKHALDAIRNNESIVIESKVMARLLTSPACLDLLAKLKLRFPEIPDPEVALNLIIENVRAVWIEASLEVRADRGILQAREEKRINGDETERSSCYISDSERLLEMDALEKRQRDNGEIFRQYYQIDDYPQARIGPLNGNFGHVIDNTFHRDSDETYTQVLELLEMAV